MSGLTAAVAKFANDVSFNALPPEAVATVKRAVMDWVGCAIAGSRSEPGRLVGSYVRGHTDRAAAPLIGTGELVAPASAALANGTSGHALDYDDFSRTMFHASVVLAPPLFALAAVAEASGENLIAAYGASFEVAARLARSMNPGHYEAGWHITSTVGCVAAAVGAAKMLGLSQRETTYAIGLAASSAGGLRDNFGTMAKPLHAGLAAEGATRAALLALGGFTASPAILEAKHGFLDVFGVGSAPSPDFSPDFLEVVRSGISFKKHACCGAMHPAIDVLLDLLNENGLRGDGIARIQCSATALAPEIVRFHEPANVEEARFSFEYSLAVAAIDHAAGLRQFSEDRVQDKDVRDLMARTNVSLQKVDKGPHFPVEIEVETTDGRVLRGEGSLLRGYPERPLSDGELAAKFIECCTPSLPRRKATRLLDLLQHIEQLKSLSEVDEMLLEVSS